MRTLCVDFDGVLHLYESTWAGPTHIPDPPVPGAIEFLTEAVHSFHVCIFSSRSSEDGGIQAMRNWLTYYELPADVLNKIEFPTSKPSAFVTLDDRAITFTGMWPTMAELTAFVPWNRLPGKG